MSSKLLVPDIGDFEKVEVIEVLVKEGDVIKPNDPVITIESDKSSVEIPSTLEGKIESLNIKVGDKVSKDDLILTVASENTSSKDEKIIPKDTENLIREAEQALKEKENVVQTNKIVTPEKPEIIQVVNQGDIDPLETQEWLESLSAVIDKDGNHRAHYLIKEL